MSLFAEDVYTGPTTIFRSLAQPWTSDQIGSRAKQTEEGREDNSLREDLPSFLSIREGASAWTLSHLPTETSHFPPDVA